jgi:hypothetical protein
MSLKDRLLNQSIELEEATYKPIDLYILKRSILIFIMLLDQSGDLPERAKMLINDVAKNIRTPIRPGFEEEYKRTFLNAAFFVQGIYKATHEL